MTHALPQGSTAERVTLRSALRDLPAYKPGKSAAVAGTVQYKLSSNENPYPPLPSVRESVAEAAAGINLYPDMACETITEAVARRWGVSPASVSFGAGSVEVASQIIRAVAGEGDEVIFAWRSFEAYPILTALAGAKAVHVPLTQDERHDLPAMAAAVNEHTRVIFVCTPNNPTGTSVTADELHDFMAAVPKDVLVVIDEAYVHFNVDPAAAQGIDFFRAYANVVILHTFSKAYGLAGLRIGYAIAPDYVSAALRAVAIPFGVSALAQKAALASLAAEEEIEARISSLVTERDKLQRGLVEIGWDVCPSEANFVWLRIGATTREIEDIFTHAGVIVRAYPGDGIRISVGAPEANDQAIHAARDAFNHFTTTSALAQEI
ncbi:histidinol-phosphate transaminase [Paenarthrobacter nitroguajacolicus]|uniref:histidinol-phosphate transaminase n=1 Tax=Paenarthrobacter nitroguajacolicus TaxID=211146 RepID=UPI0028575EE6|nr:histidinol-phosphate transaminase [Paenarthrobacter nitroguajacolicus]MDR6639622.1 histidinol-phosphate aminotransferase [Paenarthrobacter nitroguajacolicus]